MTDPPKKRLSLLWRQESWEQLARVREALGVSSDAEAIRTALGYTEALLKGQASIDGKPVIVAETDAHETATAPR